MHKRINKKEKIKARLDLKARRHVLRPCEQERKVEDMFSRKTFDGLFLDCEQRANLIKLLPKFDADMNPMLRKFMGG